MASLFQRLHNNLQAVIVATMHEKPANFHATADHTEILDKGQGLVGEESPWKSSVMENEEKVPQVFLEIVCNDGEKRASPGWDNEPTGDVSRNVTHKTAPKNLNFSKCAVYTCKEFSWDLTNISISHRVWSENAKFGIRHNSENATRICCLQDPYQSRNTVIFRIIVEYQCARKHTRREPAALFEPYEYSRYFTLLVRTQSSVGSNSAYTQNVASDPIKKSPL